MRPMSTARRSRARAACPRAWAGGRWCCFPAASIRPVAGYMIAKRGVELECVHFFSYPYTSELAKDKVLELARLMTRYCGRMTVNIVGFTEIQEAIRDNCLEEFFTLVMRRFMMKIAERIARDHGCGCLVTGENLGQVASQTMEAMAVTGACVDLPIFQPLIGMDKEEIVTRRPSRSARWRRPSCPMRTAARSLPRAIPRRSRRWLRWTLRAPRWTWRA